MNEPCLHILPVPKRLEVLPGTVRLSHGGDWKSISDDSRVTDAMHRLRERLPNQSGSSPVVVTAVVDQSLEIPGDSYRLSIHAKGVSLIGRTPAGCFYGLQTLEQLIDSPTGELPCCTISDWPDFATRGLLHDVTRGKVPTLATLKQMIDRLAALKVNQFQLYLEHSFVFSFDPEICSADEGLTPDEVRDLDAYCRHRFIDLVPAVANLGHMGRILAMPRYRHLAEIAPTLDWERMSWPQRLRGCTLDAANPDAWALVERMWTDILAAFSSPVVNICGDEPWDLGEGKNKERCARAGKADLYMGHLRRLQDYCSRKGRVTQFWGDVVRNYPHLLNRLRSEGTILHWGYDDRSDYAGTATFVRSGLPTVVCPGTSGWKRTLNAINLAERNIRTFSADGLRMGAVGLLNTDWGDHGHFNTLAASWHGMAFGACCAWRADHTSGVEFDRLFTRWAWDVRTTDFGKNLRAAANLSDECETWRMLWMPAATVAQDAAMPTRDRAHEARSAAQKLLTCLDDQRALAASDSRTYSIADDLCELAVAAEFTALAAEKFVLLRERANCGAGRAALRRRGCDWAQRLIAACGRYAQSWRRRNKPMRLADIESALSAAAKDMTDW